MRRANREGAEVHERLGILDLLEQKTIWVNRAGQRVQIAKMEPRYAANIVRWLEQRADVLKFYAEMRWLGFMEMLLNGEMARDCAEREFDSFLNLRADKWLRKRPLVRALKNRAAEEDNE